MKVDAVWPELEVVDLSFCLKLEKLIKTLVSLCSYLWKASNNMHKEWINYRFVNDVNRSFDKMQLLPVIDGTYQQDQPLGGGRSRNYFTLETPQSAISSLCNLFRNFYCLKIAWKERNRSRKWPPLFPNSSKGLQEFFLTFKNSFLNCSHFFCSTGLIDCEKDCAICEERERLKQISTKQQWLTLWHRLPTKSWRTLVAGDEQPYWPHRKWS